VQLRKGTSLKGIPCSSSSQSPLQNNRQSRTNCESTTNRLKFGQTHYDIDFSQGSSGESKENTLADQPEKNSNLFSPLTVDSNIRVHPLQFSNPRNSNDFSRTPFSGCMSSSSPTSEGQLSVSNVKRSKSMSTSGVSSIMRSPNIRFLGTSMSPYKSLSDTKLIKRGNNYGRPVEISLKARDTSSSPRKKSNAMGKDTSDEPYSLSEKVSSADLRKNISPESTVIFQSNSDDIFDSMKTKPQVNFGQAMPSNRSVSNLHSLCCSMTTVDELMKAQSLLLSISLNRASGRDYKGETILHRFSNNKALAVIIGNPNNEDYETKDFLTLYRQPSIDQKSTDELNRLVECFLVEILLPSFFGAPIAQDNDGQIPFEAGLIDWVATCQKEMHGISQESETGYFSAYTNKVSDVVTHAWESTSTTLLSAMAFGRSTSKRHRQGHMVTDIERGDSTSSTGSTTSQSIGKSKFTPHARFCLRMLSLILEEFDKFNDAFRNTKMNRQMQKYSRAIEGIKQLRNVTGPLDLCGRIIEKVASIPHLLEVIFSINNDSDLQFVLSTKIIKRVLIDKHSVGPWLTAMLQSPDRHISKRATDYLQTVSKLCSGDQGDNMENTEYELNSLSVHCEELIDEVSRLHDFIPSLLALEEKIIEEVSTSLIVKEVMDIMIARPFVATVVFCDAIFLFFMIFGFRAAVNGMIMGGQLENVLRWIYVANTGIFYFIIAEIGKFVSLFLLSKHSKNYILSFWNLIDVLAILLAALSSVTMRWQFFTMTDETRIKDDSALRGLLAITTGFLWLRVLNFLKAINMQLATFVLAILQITKDIFWFCIILLTLVVSFSQMFFTLMAPPKCATGEIEGRQCQQSEYLLSVYSILLGDFGLFSREDFASGVSVFLVVLYSFLVTVVLLNVLIAIASDSYEKCLLKSKKLFGRARVMRIAELASFQSLLRRRDQDGQSLESPATTGIVYSKWWTSSGLSRNWSRGSVLFFWLSMVVTICWTFAELVGYFRGIQVGSILMSFASVLINIALYIIIMVFLDRNSAINSMSKNELVDTKVSYSLQKVVHWVLGVSRRTKAVSSRFSRGQDVWHGRVEYLQREMGRNAERQKEIVVSQSEYLQNLMNTSEERVMTEINKIDENFKLLEASVRNNLKDTREVNSDMLRALNTLTTLISSADGSSTETDFDVPAELDVSEV